MKMTEGWWRPTAVGASVALGAGLLGLGALWRMPDAHGSAVTVAAYATDLAGRTPHQRYNARRAAAAIDGTVIGPGKVFSFNRTVRGWSADRGFLKAPVSYDGVLVDDYGGGVCQASTTVYNAALLAGLPILERHPHTFAPSYAPPGRDAAVAYAGVDLRFRNPFAWPLVLHIGPEGHRLVCRIESARPAPERVVVSGDRLQEFAPVTVAVSPGASTPRSRWRLTGRKGVRVAVSRRYFVGERCVRREVVSDDTYRPVSRAEWKVR